MPRFFDKKNLSEEQKMRWDWATSEYIRVQSDNLDRSINLMTLKQKRDVVDGFDIPDGVSFDDFVKSHLLAFNSSQPGDEKSALFARLLSGKAALPSPPPTYFSYPWYDVVEGSGPFQVMVGGVDQTRCGDKSTERGDAAFVIIGQSAWEIVSSNAAASELLNLEKLLRSTMSIKSTGPGPYDKETVFGWTSSLISSVEAAYRSNPEFMVRCGNWGPYRLRVGRSESRMVRHYASSVQSKDDGAGVPAHVGSVFDSSMLMMDLQIEDTISKGRDPTDELRDAEAAVTRTNTSGVGIMFAELNLKRLQDDYDAKIKRRAESPDCDDIVKATTLGWMLERVS